MKSTGHYIVCFILYELYRIGHFLDIEIQSTLRSALVYKWKRHLDLHTKAISRAFTGTGSNPFSRKVSWNSLKDLMWTSSSWIPQILRPLSSMRSPVIAGCLFATLVVPYTQSSLYLPVYMI